MFVSRVPQLPVKLHAATNHKRLIFQARNLQFERGFLIAMFDSERTKG